jgi:hypothetical protein
MGQARDPDAYRAHFRKKFREDVIPGVLDNRRNVTPDQVPDLVATCLAQAFPGHAPRDTSPATPAPDPGTAAALAQVAGMARTQTFSDDVIADYIADHPAIRAQLVAEARRHRPAFPDVDTPSATPAPLRDASPLVRQVATARRR